MGRFLLSNIFYVVLVQCVLNSARAETLPGLRSFEETLHEQGKTPQKAEATGEQPWLNIFFEKLQKFDQGILERKRKGGSGNLSRSEALERNRLLLNIHEERLKAQIAFYEKKSKEAAPNARSADWYPKQMKEILKKKQESLSIIRAAKSRLEKEQYLRFSEVQPFTDYASIVKYAADLPLDKLPEIERAGVQHARALLKQQGRAAELTKAKSQLDYLRGNPDRAKSPNQQLRFKELDEPYALGFQYNALLDDMLGRGKDPFGTQRLGVAPNGTRRPDLADVIQRNQEASQVALDHPEGVRFTNNQKNLFGSMNQDGLPACSAFAIGNAIDLHPVNAPTWV